MNNVHDGIFMTDVKRHIIFWNRGAENITGFKDSELRGKLCSESFLRPLDDKGTLLCEYSCPLQKVIAEGNIHQVKTYFKHKEGFRVPVSVRCIPLYNRKGHLIGIANSFTDTSPKVLMPQRTLELKRMELIDPLTGVGNKRYLEMQLHSRLNEKKLYRLQFGLIFVDLDRLSNINDTYGEGVGDRILITVSQSLANNIRFFDSIGRWSDEEFLVIILNVDEPKLDFVANKLRLLVAESNIVVNTSLVGVTVSMGATTANLTDNIDSLVNRAQSLMNHSKQLGRNQVSLNYEKKDIRP